MHTNLNENLHIKWQKPNKNNTKKTSGKPKYVYIWRLPQKTETFSLKQFMLVEEKELSLCWQTELNSAHFMGVPITILVLIIKPCGNRSN